MNHWTTMADIPAETPVSREMSKDLKRRGFRFVGPTVCYAFMQAVGMVNDHVAGCFRWTEVNEPHSGYLFAANTQEGIDIVPVAQVEQLGISRGLSEEQAKAVASDYGDAQLDALRVSIGAVAVIALLSLWFTRRLPAASAEKPGGTDPAAAPVSA